METVHDALQEHHELTAKLIQAENHLLRESIDYFANYVDPQDAFRGPDGTLWPCKIAIASKGARPRAHAAIERLIRARLRWRPSNVNSSGSQS